MPDGALQKWHRKVDGLTTAPTRLAEKGTEDIKRGVGLEIKEHEKELLGRAYRERL